MSPDLIRRFRAALPQVKSWIDQHIALHALSARTLSSFGYGRLITVYPQDLVERARVVLVPRTPFPPVTSFGLPEFGPMQQRPFDGITFRDTIFVRNGAESDPLLFHELVHVVQWGTLGPDNFLLAYGAGLAQYGYENSPLERMAYELQAHYMIGAPPPALVDFIERGTAAIWEQARPVFAAGAPES